MTKKQRKQCYVKVLCSGIEQMTSVAAEDCAE
jgi:hypothetical protein